MNISNRVNRQPLSQIDFNQEDIRGTTPTHKQFKTATTTLNSDYKNNQNYNVQFKVGVKQVNNQVSDSSRLNENNSVFMSPMPLRRNTQFQLQQQQQQLMRSPVQKNYSQTNIQPIPTSPITKPNLKFREASQQPQLSNNISHTTTQQLQSEVQFLKEQNTKLQQSVFKLESEIQRGTSTTFIKELENKIAMLQQLNDKLNQDNYQLIQISNVDSLRNEREEQSKKLSELEQQYDQLLAQFEQFDCIKLQELENKNENNNINCLVSDLESKISGLIQENEQLNAQTKQQKHYEQQIEQAQLEVQSQQIIYQKSRHDEVQFRFKYDQLLHEEKIGKQQKTSSRTYPKLEKIKEKITVLEEENEKLRSLVRDDDFDEEISDLEDRVQYHFNNQIRVIAQDNKKLEQQLLQTG